MCCMAMANPDCRREPCEPSQSGAYGGRAVISQKEQAMEARVNLEDLDVVVRHRNGRYLAKIPRIGLYATADSLPKAIEALEAKKQSLREELSQAGALDEISAPWRPEQRGMIASLAL